MAYREQRATPRVRCCVCGHEVEQARADIVELGYRCLSCSLLAPAAGAVPAVADPALEVDVPAGALMRPAGAATNLDGSVSCIACGQAIAMANADIVGEGYRCGTCSHRAEIARVEGDSDIAAHLSKRDRRDLAGARARVMNTGGVVLVVGGVTMLIATGGTSGLFLAVGGVISLVGNAIRRS